MAKLKDNPREAVALEWKAWPSYNCPNAIYDLIYTCIKQPTHKHKNTKTQKNKSHIINDSNTVNKMKPKTTKNIQNRSPTAHD